MFSPYGPNGCSNTNALSNCSVPPPTNIVQNLKIERFARGNEIYVVLAQGVQLKRNPKTGVENKKVLIQWLN